MYKWVNPDGEVELYPSKEFIPGDKGMYILSNALVWKIDNPSYPVVSVKEPGPKNREKWTETLNHVDGVYYMFDYPDSLRLVHRLDN
ncbi:unnamed protein product [Rhizophagus irregularis]|uniref:Uncharacterized protein n=1 Tax=Rhizophagus irregularis TaxID=588596 RepID=A0A915Z3W7_9GLOM|nr:unnamed protein product [Rhizophagus irregularis]